MVQAQNRTQPTTDANEGLLSHFMLASTYKLFILSYLLIYLVRYLISTNLVQQQFWFDLIQRSETFEFKNLEVKVEIKN